MTETKSDERFDVGSMLRQKRMQRGASLEAVHQQTRIPKKLLEALENNRVDAFPASVYLRGFLKGYCDYLDLDFEDLWKKLAPGAQGSEAEPAAPEAPAAAPSKDKPVAAAMPALSRAPLVPSLVALAVIVIVAAMWIFREKPKPVQAPPRTAEPPAAISPVAPLSEPTLSLTAVRDTWIRLKVDGVLRFEGRVPAGQRQDWKAKKDFSLRAASPQEIRVLVDGKEVPLDRFPLEPDGFRKIAR